MEIASFKLQTYIDPALDRHLVSYLVEVGDPCETFSYSIDGVSVSDFVTPEYYNNNAPLNTEFDLLRKLRQPLQVSNGCYISFEIFRIIIGIKRIPMATFSSWSYK